MERSFAAFPTAENTAAAQTLTLGWFGDQFAGTLTPDYYPGGTVYDDPGGQRHDPPPLP